jgi:hypothetical protein
MGGGRMIGKVVSRDPRYDDRVRLRLAEVV